MKNILKNNKPMSKLIIILLTIILSSSTLFANDLLKRDRSLFDSDWKFARGDIENAETLQFDESHWEILNLPHDWSIEGEFSKDEPTSGRGGYLPTGIGWYRKSFRMSNADLGKNVWIEFDGIYQNSTVWVNGKKVGYRPFGYISFYYDITPYLKKGNNVIAVKVDNSNQPNTRWYSGSGIYRHVWLSIIDRVHIDHWGIFVTTPQVSDSISTVNVKTKISNESNTSKNYVLKTIVLNESGDQVMYHTQPFNLAINESKELVQEILVNNPRLWSIKSPNLYTIHSQILSGKKIIDDQITTFGIRKISYDTKNGFLLNGQRVKMNGVCLHHDGGPVGSAVPERVWERRFEILKAMGCNAIRTSHNPMASEFLDLCDKMGFVVMDEVFDEWTHGKVQNGYNKYFEEWSQIDLVDFIHRDRNHPSVVMWSAGNEIGEQSIDGGHEILKPLIDTFHREDNTRPVTTGNDHIAADGRTATIPFLNMLDIVGYNYMDRWHERRELYASADKQEHNDWLIVGTESSSIRNGRGNYSLGDDPEKVSPNYTKGIIRTEQLWKFVAMNDYVIGDFMWTGIDYLGEARWPNKNSGSGEIDLAGFPKDGYYFYQSQWVGEPVLHLFPHWNWKGREGQFIPILAYTNCDTVELFLNDRSIGIKSSEFPRQGTSGGWNSYDKPKVQSTTADLHFSWDVPYEPGTLKAVGRKDGKIVLIKEIKTTGKAISLRLIVDRKIILSDSRDVSHIRIEGVDENGLIVPIADNSVSLEVIGEGKLIGFENGNPSDKDSPKGNIRKLYNGLALGIIQSTNKEGKIVVRAETEDMKEAEIEIITSKKAGSTFVFKDFNSK
jgi:beta-galactosidase